MSDDKLGDWLREYDRYLDGEIEYQDLPPLPAPPLPVEVMTTDEVYTLVVVAAARSRRTARRFTAIAAAPLVGLTVALYALHAPWLAILGAQWAFALSFTKGYSWYMERKESRSRKRDTTLDESGKDSG